MRNFSEFESSSIKDLRSSISSFLEMTALVVESLEAFG